MAIPTGFKLAQQSALSGELGVIQNPRGGVSTEKSITVTDPRVNQGRATNLPLLVQGQTPEAIQRILADEGTQEDINIAITRALQRVSEGQELPSFDSINLAVEAAIARSESGGSLKKFEDSIPKGFKSVSTQPQTPQTQPTLGEEALGIAETGLAIGSTAVGEAFGGAIGAAEAAVPFGISPEEGEQLQTGIQDILQFQPRTETGKRNLRAIGENEFVKQIGEFLQQAERIGGEFGFDLLQPIAQELGIPGIAGAGGAIGATIPAAILELFPALKASQAAAKVGRGAKAVAGDVPDVPERSIIETGEAAGVPILTTDVIPPKTSAGKFAQQTLEKFGPLGTGTTRARQQAARENVVQEIAKEFDVELDSPFAEDIVKSLKKNNLRVLGEASEQRNKAIDALVPFGDVPTNKTIAAIDEQLAKQASLGEKADTSLVSNLDAIKNSIDGDFSHLRDIRTEVINDLKALGRSEDQRAEGSLQQVKSAIDKDMIAFARTKDKQAAADWLRSNRKFADEFQKTKQTELKRILNTGEATPEKVLAILKGGKASELKRLNSSLTPKGRAAARASIIQNALDQSGFFRDDINPDRFTTAINKTNTKRAIDAFFSPADKKALDGLIKVLDATRRAQQAEALPSTGVQSIQTVSLIGTGAGAVVNLAATLGGITSVAVLARVFEAPAVRNALLKLSNAKPGTRRQAELAESAGLALASALQASKEENKTQQ